MKNKTPKIIAAGLVKKGDKYLLIKEILSSGNPFWIVPGGKVDYGETLEQAVIREIQEEVGLTAKKVEFLIFKEAIFPDFGYHSLIFFYLINSFTGKLKITETDQILAAKFFTKKEALKQDLVE